ncbi:5'-nucleotidase SurE [Spirochaetia bacterium]|nr:5'-nucleotidase SurE [Spirochaetia bacterium]
MRILLTNDDGIDSDGLLLLAEALRADGRHRVYVIAPDSNRSAVSHGIVFMYNALKLVQTGEDSWSCSGLPVDCVMAALLGGFIEKPDLVISGINRGPNLGTDLVYSGTAAAARQAALCGIPGIALSLAAFKDFHWKGAIRFVTAELDSLLSLWREDVFINVNLPNNAEGPAGMLLTYPSRRFYRDTMAELKTREKVFYFVMDSGAVDTEYEEGSDFDAVSRDLVSISPVFIHPVVRRDLCPQAPEHAKTAPRPVRGG